MKMRGSLSVVIALLFVASTTGLAGKGAEQTKPEDELHKIGQKTQETVKQVLKVLRNEEMPSEEKQEKALDIISPVFNFELMGKLCIGQKYWREFSEKQRETFIDLFIKHLQVSYFGKAEMFADEEVKYDEPEWRKEGTRAVANSYVRQDGEKQSIRYAFYKKEDDEAKWLVYDVVIEGVSLVRSYGSQYRDVLQDGDIEDLFSEIRDSI